MNSVKALGRAICAPTLFRVKHIVHRNVQGGSMLGFRHVIADSEQEMPGIKPALI